MSKPISVAYVNDAWFPFWGGGQVHLDNLSKQLASDFGVSFQIFYPPHRHVIIRLIWVGIIPIYIWLINSKRNFTLIHSHGYLSGLSGKLTAILLKIPIIHTVHGSNLLDLGIKNPKSFVEKFLLTGIKYDSQITVSSTFTKHPNINTSIYHIPNGVDIELFDAIKVRKHRQPTMIWVGRKDEPLKGFAILQLAYKKLRLRYPSLKLEVVSNGRKTGTELIKAYKKAQVFVLPSLSEGQPISLLEAWAGKLPVVVSRVGDNPRMVVHTRNGLLIKPGNAKDIIKAVGYILDNPQQARVMGTAGYGLVKKKYTWKTIAKKTYRIYQKVVKHRKKLSN